MKTFDNKNKLIHTYFPLLLNFFVSSYFLLPCKKKKKEEGIL